MEIEIVEFYPVIDKKKPAFMGTMHAFVQIGELSFDIRGLQCWKKNGWLHVFPFVLVAMDEGKKVKYPILSLTNHALNEELKQKILEAGREFYEEYQKTNRVHKDRRCICKSRK